MTNAPKDALCTRFFVYNELIYVIFFLDYINELINTVAKYGKWEV